jgi:hypothetical protein
MGMNDYPILISKLDLELQNIIPDPVMRKIAIQRVLRVVFLEN